MSDVRYALFDAGGTLVEVEYRYLREVLAQVESGGLGEERNGAPAGNPGGSAAVTAPAPAGAPTAALARHGGEYSGVRAPVSAEAPALGVPASRAAQGLPTDEAFERGEIAARAWFMEQIERGGIPIDGPIDSPTDSPIDRWHSYFERVYAGAGVSAALIPDLLKRLWQKNVTGGLWHRPAPDAAATLDHLRGRGLRLAVISNAEGRVAEDLEAAGLAGYFETIVDSHKVGVAKPDPRIFAIALERLGARTEESVYVGDLYGVDVRGARAAGLSAVLIDRWRLQLEADCPRIERLSELPSVLLGRP